MKHSTKPRRIESQALAFWRQLDATLREVGEEAPQYGEAATLFAAGYSVPQAARVLAPGARFHADATRDRGESFQRCGDL